MSRSRVFRGLPDSWWIGLGALSIATVLFYSVFGSSDDYVRSHGTDAYSRSAIGHQALVEVLRQVPGASVLVSRFRSVKRARAGDLLLLLEPPPGRAKQLTRMIRTAGEEGVRVLVVLPKWFGAEGGSRRGWVEEVRMVPRSQVQQVVDTVMSGASGDDTSGDSASENGSSEDGTTVSGGSGSLQVTGRRAAGSSFVVDPTERRLSLPFPQWLEASGQGPASTVWESDGRSLLVEVGGASGLWLLSDPDLINTAGLGKAENAEAFLDWVASLDAGAVVIDETLHGYEMRPSPWRAMLEMPLLPLTLQAFLLACLALWAATARFGVPLTVPSRLPPGKLTLVENTARLLGLGKFNRYAVERYRDLTIRRSAESLGIQGTPEEVVRRLRRLAGHRGVEQSIDSVDRVLSQVDPAPMGEGQAVILAQQLHGFRKEITNDQRR